MARITQAQRHANKERYDAEVYELFLDIGWEKLTYERVSKHLNVKKSTLQSYYPSKHDFFEIWRGKHVDKYYEVFDFSSKQAFLASWRVMLDDDFLAKLLKYSIESSIQSSSVIQNSFNPIIQQLADQLSKVMTKEEAIETMQIAIGIAVLHFSVNNLS